MFLGKDELFSKMQKHFCFSTAPVPPYTTYTHISSQLEAWEDMH